MTVLWVRKSKGEWNVAKKKEATAELKDWSEVDETLKRMGEIDIEREKIDGRMTLKINEIKQDYAEQDKPLVLERDRLENSISAFVEARKAEFVKVRSKVLNFGTVGFRVTRKITFRNKESVVAALKAAGLLQFVRTVEEPNKEAMEGLDDLTLTKLGANRKVEDKLTVEPNIERLSEEAKAA